MLDLCAGRGGKAIAIALDMMKEFYQKDIYDSTSESDNFTRDRSPLSSLGMVICYDNDKSVLHALKHRVLQAGCADVCTMIAQPTRQAIATVIKQHCPGIHTNKGNHENDDEKRCHRTSTRSGHAGDNAENTNLSGNIESERRSGRQTKRARKETAIITATTSDKTTRTVATTASAVVAGEHRDASAKTNKDSSMMTMMMTGEEGLVDTVLIDAPCSRLGILRRGPGSRTVTPDLLFSYSRFPFPCLQYHYLSIQTKKCPCS